ncbi:YesN/AraC family two-component response regulator [Paenibacillus endophyticus]|uniref:YesN/AraC family two-component response regulator n=1 Tax=Paenibacillus endophyticus TaxID=1294268 RepID=A0A7W5GCU8_9BACL|nr:response regulator [Paenibacillus endophyticus]MBB3155261.1 YesN/AraC family two-component response regulator [Paenibacillus endophyticus]
MNILLVEDEPKIRQGLRDIISDVIKHNLSLHEASNGKEALDWLRTGGSVDLVITDIRMGEMNGLELLKRIKSLYPELALIVISGHDEFGYAREALRYGVLDYLLKPIERVELATLLNKVKEALREKRGGDAENEQGDDQQEKGRLLIRKVKELVRQSLGQDISLQFLAEHVYLHPKYLSDLFKRETGQNLSEYVTKMRLEKARLLLKDTTLKIADIAEMCGFANHKYFASLFKQHVGQTPSEFRES